MNTGIDGEPSDGSTADAESDVSNSAAPSMTSCIGLTD